MMAGIVRRGGEEEARTMSRHVVVEWGESAEELYALYAGESDLTRRKRLQALWLVRSGVGVAEASRLAGVGRRSAERWLAWYRRGGLAEALRRVPGHGARGGPGRLTAEQRERLLGKAREGAFRTYDEARAWVAEEFGVRYSYQGIYSVLPRLEVHPKVPRPMSAKADPAAQEAWKRGASRRRSARRT
jgi:transposase